MFAVAGELFPPPKPPPIAVKLLKTEFVPFDITVVLFIAPAPPAPTVTV
jgi:hypothetical protein